MQTLISGTHQVVGVEWGNWGTGRFEAGAPNNQLGEEELELVTDMG